MTDLLQQAVDTLTTEQRASINLDLARIQNCENLGRDWYYHPWPAFQLAYALRREMQRECNSVAHDWDYGYAVKGLA